MYEIEIYATDEEQEIIAELLNEAGIGCEIEDDTFFAHLPYYGQVVDAINSLGFETDEDE